MFVWKDYFSSYGSFDISNKPLTIFHQMSCHYFLLSLSLYKHSGRYLAWRRVLKDDQISEQNSYVHSISLPLSIFLNISLSHIFLANTLCYSCRHHRITCFNSLALSGTHTHTHTHTHQKEFFSRHAIVCGCEHYVGGGVQTKSAVQH
jgi:hypothetical protein